MVSYQDRLKLDPMITTIEAKPRFDRLERRTIYKLGERDFGVRINIWDEIQNIETYVLYKQMELPKLQEQCAKTGRKWWQLAQGWF